MTTMMILEPVSAGGIARGASRSLGVLMDTISFEEMAQRLRVSVKTVRKAVRDGQFPSVMVGKRRKALRQPFEALLRSRAAELDKPGNRGRAG